MMRLRLILLLLALGGCATPPLLMGKVPTGPGVLPAYPDRNTLLWSDR